MSVPHPGTAREGRHVSMPREMVTPRAVAVGIVCSLILGIADPYSNMIIQGSYLGSNFTPIGVVFLFAVLVGIVNTVLRTWSPAHALTQGELAVVYIMSLIASAIPSYGLTEVLLPAMASMYYATPENRWLDNVGPHVEPWLMPQDPEVVRSFFEGLPRGGVIPWGEWAVPLAAWLSFVLVLYFVVFCITVILRKQWVERERLIFPLVKLPAEMIDPGEDGSPSRLAPFFRNRIMWAGFAIPFLINAWNSIHNYIYFFPTIYFQESIGLFNNQLVLPINLSFPLLGFAYLLSLEISFSLWLFFLIGRLQNLTNATFGVDLAGSTTLPGEYQMFGALLVLALFSIWLARGHIREVLGGVFKGGGKDDANECLSYRFAVIGVGLGILFLLGWLWMIGLSPWLAAILLILVLAVYIGFARIVAEGGLIFAETFNPQEFMIHGFTGPFLGARNLVAIGLTRFWFTHTRTLIMPSMANGLKLADTARIGNQRWLTAAIGLAILSSLAGSIYTVMYLAYEYGGINLNWHFFGELQQNRFGYYATTISSTSEPSGRWFFFGLGAAIMWALMFLRQKFIWWPLHFIGFPVGASAPLLTAWFSIFLAWMLKGLILKYGGIDIYRKMLPFFLGLILGEFVSAGFWVIIDGLTGITGHIIFN